MASMSRRRLLICAAGAPFVGPLAWADGRSTTPMVGFLAGGEETANLVKLLAELGHVEGKNLRVEAVAAPSGRGLASAAVKLIRRDPDVLVGEGLAALALAALTKTIPIVCAGVTDPVASGLAQSLDKPGGNVTGLATASPEAVPTILGVLRQVRPSLRRIAVLHLDSAPDLAQLLAHGQAAKAAGFEWTLVPVNSIEDAERVLPAFAGEAAWMASLGGPRLWRPALEIAQKHRIATAGRYPGTLVWYTRVFSDAPRRLAGIVDRILKGAKAADIAFELPDRPVLTVNRSAARAIGMEIPEEVLKRATDVVD